MADYSSLFTSGLFQICTPTATTFSSAPSSSKRTSGSNSSLSSQSSRPRRPTISEQYRSFLSFDVAESLRSLTRTDSSWGFTSGRTFGSVSTREPETHIPIILDTPTADEFEPSSPRSTSSRRSLPEAKPAPSSVLPAVPSSTSSSPILHSQRPLSPAPLPTATSTASPAYTTTLARSRSQRSRDAGITHSAPPRPSSDIDSLRTVSTGYRHTQRSDALARLEGRDLPPVPRLPSPLRTQDLNVPTASARHPKRRHHASFIPRIFENEQAQSPVTDRQVDIYPLAYATSGSPRSPPLFHSHLHLDLSHSKTISSSRRAIKSPRRKRSQSTLGAPSFPSNFMDMGDMDTESSLSSSNQLSLGTSTLALGEFNSLMLSSLISA